MGGGIPVIGPFRLDLLANEIHEVTAIINGTDELHPDEMAREGMPATRDALARGAGAGLRRAGPAQRCRRHRRGLQAHDPRHARVPRACAPPTSTSRDHPPDGGGLPLRAGAGLRDQAAGDRPRRLATAWSCACTPRSCPADEMLAKVDGVFNAVRVDGDLVGQILFYGRGAGAGPTSSAVVADVIDIAQRSGRAAAPAPMPPPYSTSSRPARWTRCATRYYLRLLAATDPGSSPRSPRRWGRPAISIASVIQKENVVLEAPATSPCRDRADDSPASEAADAARRGGDRRACGGAPRSAT